MTETNAGIGIYTGYETYGPASVTAPRGVGVPQPQTQPLLTTTLIVAADLLGLTVAVSAGLCLGGCAGSGSLIGLLGSIWPFPMVMLIAFGASGLYPGVAIAPAAELRLITYTLTGVYAVIGAGLMFGGLPPLATWGSLAIGWALSCVLVPAGRWTLRAACSSRPWWGQSVVVVGAGSSQRDTIRALQREPAFGLKPVAVLDDQAPNRRPVRGVPVVGGLDQAEALSQELGVHYAVLTGDADPQGDLADRLADSQHYFSRTLVLPDTLGLPRLWAASSGPFGQGFSWPSSLSRTRRELVKRLWELPLTLLLFATVLPLIGLVALLVRLDSPGPIFYGHVRIGRGGRRFKAWKFRSMVENADEVLQQYLAAHPRLREEWERNQKIKDDPRITRIGRFLRRTSLDELPQIWNVLKGEMTLIGPRPIIESEIPRYGDMFDLYLQAKPGLSGLWQVSGRNNTTYRERVSLDAYYIRNANVWLDLYILARTVGVVLTGYGAY